MVSTIDPKKTKRVETLSEVTQHSDKVTWFLFFLFGDFSFYISKLNIFTTFKDCIISYFTNK